jgi:hypothetical protein
VARTEADRPIWQDRAGAIAKVRRRQPRGGAAWPRGGREAAAGGWTTREAAAYPGPDGGRDSESGRMAAPRRARDRQQRDEGSGWIGESGGVLGYFDFVSLTVLLRT